MSKKEFIHPDFLLQNKWGVKLYHEVAASLRIIDYHNHISPVELVTNKSFDNVGQLWVNADPYKHRMMRLNGISEERISGTAEDWDKFTSWASTLPLSLGNPLYHWSRLELKRVFDWDEELTEKNAAAVWEHCNLKLKEEDFKAVPLLKSWKVEALCTSDELLDDLTPHQTVSNQNPDLELRPSLRGDTILKVGETAFLPWIEKLSEQTGITIKNLEDYKAALQKRLVDFHEAGCLLADHALDAGFTFFLPTEKQAEQLFQKAIEGNSLNHNEQVELQSYLLDFLGKAYADKGWIMQLHIGAQRHTSSRLRRLAGAAGGYACIGTSLDVASLCNFLDGLEKEEKLPKTILYTLNPADYEPLATLTGSFAEDGVPAKMQLGPAWWYNDHLEGMERQMTALANYGIFSRFIGMTTDSRSLLSFSRHEYFRRILCNWIGNEVEKGHFPSNFEQLAALVKAICYENAAEWVLNKKSNYSGIKNVIPENFDR